MKTIVAYYSRTGNTKKIAQDIAKCLDADIDEIIDKKGRSGPSGFLTGGRDAMKGHETEIESSEDPEEYGLVVIGTPIWAGTVTPAVRSYLSKHKFKKVAFFCTCGGSQGNSFEEMQKLSKKPLALLEIKQSELASDKARAAVKKFCRELGKGRK